MIRRVSFRSIILDRFPAIQVAVGSIIIKCFITCVLIRKRTVSYIDEPFGIIVKKVENVVSGTEEELMV